MIEPYELHTFFTYDPETGDLFWKIPAARRRKIGEKAGCKSSDGRILIGIKGKLYKAHRIIWAMKTGKWPTYQIDHINENPSDNRWVNLREATKSQNMMNITRIKSNKSGYKGVSFDNKNNKWYSRIKVDGKTHFLGYFENIEDAFKARIAAAEKLHGVFAKH